MLCTQLTMQTSLRRRNFSKVRCIACSTIVGNSTAHARKTTKKWKQKNERRKRSEDKWKDRSTFLSPSVYPAPIPHTSSKALQSVLPREESDAIAWAWRRCSARLASNNSEDFQQKGNQKQANEGHEINPSHHDQPLCGSVEPWN